MRVFAATKASLVTIRSAPNLIFLVYLTKINAGWRDAM